jgi:hypothetical protein
VIEVIMAAGRFADALAVTEESVAAYRILSAADPARYRPELSQSLDQPSGGSVGPWPTL